MFPPANMHSMASNQMSYTGQEHSSMVSSSEANLTQVVWGTNIQTAVVQTEFKNFLMNFTVEGADGQGQVAYYTNELMMMKDTEDYAMDLDCTHLHSFNPELYSQLVNFPSEVIPFMDMVAANYFKEVTMQPEMEVIVQIRPINMLESKAQRELGPEDIDKLIQVQGIIIRCSSIVPDLKEAHFKCMNCNHRVNIPVNRSKLEPPAQCKMCKTRGNECLEIDHNQCTFGDTQHVKMQETQESVPEGDTPHHIQLKAFDDHVDYVRPGDRVLVTGIFRAHGMRINQSR